MYYAHATTQHGATGPVATKKKTFNGGECRLGSRDREMGMARARVVDANGGFGKLGSRLAREADVLLLLVAV